MNTITDDMQYDVELAALSNGNFVATWTSVVLPAGLGTVFAQIYDSAGNLVGSKITIPTDTSASNSYPAISALSDGFVVTWDYYGKDQSGIWTSYGQRFEPNGVKLGSEFRVPSTTSQDRKHSSVTGLSNNEFVVTWQSASQDGSGLGVYGQRFDSTGNKVGSEFLINTHTANDQKIPAVSSLKEGGFVVIWTSDGQDGSDYGVYGQIFDDNFVKSGSEFRVNSTTAGNQGVSSNSTLHGASVASLEGGGFVVTWTSQNQDGSGYGLYGQLYDENGNSSGSEILLNSTTTGDQIHGHVTALSDGGFIASWTDNDNTYGGEGSDVFSQRFSSTGVKIGDEFQLNTYVSSDQQAPTTTQLSDGNIISAWQSTGQDGDNEGIFAQIFNPGISTSTSNISKLDTALQTLNSRRASLGALSNRVDHIISNNTNIAINIAKSISRIEDADFAAEITNLAKQQIIQQASIAMLAQANASKQNILNLLQGWYKFLLQPK